MGWGGGGGSSRCSHSPLCLSLQIAERDLPLLISMSWCNPVQRGLGLWLQQQYFSTRKSQDTRRTTWNQGSSRTVRPCQETSHKNEIPPSSHGGVLKGEMLLIVFLEELQTQDVNYKSYGVFSSSLKCSRFSLVCFALAEWHVRCFTGLSLLIIEHFFLFCVKWTISDPVAQSSFLHLLK